MKLSVPAIGGLKLSELNGTMADAKFIPNVVAPMPRNDAGEVRATAPGPLVAG
jgi:hypothetical protein